MSEIDKKGGEAARAAWLYYHENMTQAEIGQDMDISRSTVTRLLQRAKTEGLVQITLNVSSGTFKTERDIERAYGVRRVRIVPYTNDQTTLNRWLGHVAAEILVPMVADKAVVAVSWGTTLQAMADSLVGKHPAARTRIVALIGGLHNASRGTNTYEVAKQLGEYFNAPALALHAPVYVPDEATALGLASDPGIRDVLALARKASIVVYSVGSMHQESTMLKLDYITAAQEKFLRKHGAVGEIACRWIDRDGVAIELPPATYPTGISLDELKKIPHRLAVAGGELKHDIIRAALRGGFVTTLVTDERTALYLLDSR